MLLVTRKDDPWGSSKGRLSLGMRKTMAVHRGSLHKGQEGADLQGLRVWTRWGGRVSAQTRHRTDVLVMVAAGV